MTVYGMKFLMNSQICYNKGSDKIFICSNCGAIVIDMESDGRVYPGRYQKMKLPALCKEKIHNNDI